MDDNETRMVKAEKEAAWSNGYKQGLEDGYSRCTATVILFAIFAVCFMGLHNLLYGNPP